MACDNLDLLDGQAVEVIDKNVEKYPL